MNNNIGFIPTGFDRSAPCGCRWSSRLHGNECPEHGMPVNSAVVLTPEDITRIHVEMDDDWHEVMARPVTLSPAGEDAVLRVLDPASDAGRPTAPSQAVPEVGLEDVKRLRRTMADGLLAAMDYEIGESEEKGASAETLYEMRRQLKLVAEWLE